MLGVLGLRMDGQKDDEGEIFMKHSSRAFVMFKIRCSDFQGVIIDITREVYKKAFYTALLPGLSCDLSLSFSVFLLINFTSFLTPPDALRFFAIPFSTRFRFTITHT